MSSAGFSPSKYLSPPIHHIAQVFGKLDCKARHSELSVSWPSVPPREGNPGSHPGCVTVLSGPVRGIRLQTLAPHCPKHVQAQQSFKWLIPFDDLRCLKCPRKRHFLGIDRRMTLEVRTANVCSVERGTDTGLDGNSYWLSVASGVREDPVSLLTNALSY